MNYTVSIRKRSDTWSYQILVDGKYHSSKSGFKNKTDAKRAGDSAALKIKTPERNKQTFKEIADLYIEDGMKQASSKRVYKQWLKNLEPLWNIEITKITYSDVSPVIFDYYSTHKYTGTKSLVGLGKSVIRFANRKLKIDVDDPFDEIALRKQSDKAKRKTRVLTSDQIMKLIDQEPDPDVRWLYACAGLAGLRIAEARATRPRTVNVKGGRIKVDKQRTESNVVKKVMKSEGGDRSIKMHPKLIEEYMKLVIPLDKDEFFIKRFVSSTEVKNAMERAGYPDTTLHALRHSFATICIQRGMDFKTLADTIGDKLETVVSTYAHVNTDMQKRADDIISGKDLTKVETIEKIDQENHQKMV